MPDTDRNRSWLGRSMVEAVALVGPPAKIADELPEWRSSLIPTMLVYGSPAKLATIADLVRG